MSRASPDFYRASTKQSLSSLQLHRLSTVAFARFSRTYQMEVAMIKRIRRIGTIATTLLLLVSVC